MTEKIKTTGWSSKEVIFQIVLHALVFLFYSMERNQTSIPTYKIAFFLNYAIAAFFINYVLLPRFYYQKKTILFFVIVLLTFVGVILVEEFILEKIFFTGNRANSFGGLLLTMSQVLPPIAMLSGFKFGWDALGKQREVDELKITVKESELQFLKSQINPHFLFNNLNNLYSYAIEQSPKTPEIILELSGLLRYMLYECKEDFVSLTKEVEQLENFINLSEMQIEERGTVNFSSQNIQSNYQIAPLILIVFIENAFKHSTASQSDDIKIEVSVQLSESGILEFMCTNSFLPKSNTDSLSNGIGLENVKKRLKLTYPNAHQLNIKDGNNIYEVRLKINLATKE
ncbi:MAG: sensor histidine kinase [Saprospiraceae bacterium]